MHTHITDMTFEDIKPKMECLVLKFLPEHGESYKDDGEQDMEIYSMFRDINIVYKVLKIVKIIFYIIWY